MNSADHRFQEARYTLVKNHIVQRLASHFTPQHRGHDSGLLLSNHLDVVSAVACREPGVRRQLASLTDDQLFNMLEGRKAPTPAITAPVIRPAQSRNNRNRDSAVVAAREETIAEREAAAAAAEAATRRSNLIAWRPCLRSAKAVREEQWRAVLHRSEIQRKFGVSFTEERGRIRIQLRRFQREPRIFDILRARTHQLFDLEERRPQYATNGLRVIAEDLIFNNGRNNSPVIDFLHEIFHQAEEGAPLGFGPNDRIPMVHARGVAVAPAAGNAAPAQRQLIIPEHLLWIRPRDQRNRRERVEAQRQRHQHLVNRTNTVECEMCGNKKILGEFYRHFMHCKKTSNASKMTQTRLLSEYFQTDYVAQKMFKELSDEIEMEFYVGAINRKDNSNEAACSLCETFEDHQSGKCFQDNLVAVFKQRANLIVNELIAQFTQHRHMLQQLGLAEIENKHNEHFSILEEKFSTEPCDEETESQRERDWYEFRKTTIEKQAREKQEFLKTTTKKDKELISNRHTALLAELEKYINLVSTTVRMNIDENYVHVARALVRQHYRERGLEVPEGFRVKDETMGEPVVDVDIDKYYRNVDVRKKVARGSAYSEMVPLRRRWGLLNRRDDAEAAPREGRRQREAVNNVQQRLNMLDMHLNIE